MTSAMIAGIDLNLQGISPFEITMSGQLLLRPMSNLLENTENFRVWLNPLHRWKDTRIEIADKSRACGQNGLYTLSEAQVFPSKRRTNGYAVLLQQTICSGFLILYTKMVFVLLETKHTWYDCSRQAGVDGVFSGWESQSIQHPLDPYTLS